MFSDSAIYVWALESDILEFPTKYACYPSVMDIHVLPVPTQPPTFKAQRCLGNTNPTKSFQVSRFSNRMWLMPENKLSLTCRNGLKMH